MLVVDPKRVNSQLAYFAYNSENKTYYTNCHQTWDDVFVFSSVQESSKHRCYHIHLLGFLTLKIAILPTICKS